MKYFFSICLLLGCLAPILSSAQQVQVQDPNPTSERIKAYKVAFITQRLGLTPQEAEVFWPIFNQYENELRIARRTNQGDPLAQEEAVLNVQKRYQGQFTQILGGARANRFYGLDREFNRILLQHVNPNRPRMGMGPRARGY